MAEHKRPYGRAQLDRQALAAGEPLTFVASSTGINRYGYSLRHDGWRLENYNANPVVLWMHNPLRPPIGQGRALSKDDAVILDMVTFDAEDELARAVESKFRRGFLNAVSVSWGFLDKDGAPVNDWWRLSNEQIREEMFYDLEEVSAVSIPGDPRALVQQSRLALASLGKELVELFEEQEHGTITRAELRDEVRAELTRLGIDLDVQDKSEQAAGHIDHDAARKVLAAFDLQARED